MSMVVTSVSAPVAVRSGEHLVLRLRSSRVIQNLERSPLFTEEETNRLKECLAAVTERNIPIVLSFMLTEVILSAFVKAEGDKKNQLGAFANDVYELLAIFLPPGTDVDEYVKQNDAIDREGLPTLIKKINELFHTRFEQIILKGKQLDQKIDQEYEAIKSEVLRVNQQHREAREMLSQALQPLVQRIRSAAQELEAGGLALQQMAQDMQQQKIEIQKLLGDINELCRNI